ncbi:MAG: GHKL domain-containing protein [Nitrospirae bacterium]|nr:GHKL domain-containing protein [Nitrospirota bacterium]
MAQDTVYKKLKGRYEKVKLYIERADIIFFVLRVVVLAGGIAWLIFSDISQSSARDVTNLFIYFTVYSIFIYLLLFISSIRKEIIYLLSLIFDFAFVSLLVSVSGGFDSPFFTGFYLITALYSFYYGYITGITVAGLSTVLYFKSTSSDYNFDEFHWTNFAVRSVFLFLLALPIGMLSEKLKKDKEKISNLNKELEGSIDALRLLQGKLVQAERLAAMGKLTADVAHEIRNPLTSIGGFAKRLDKILPEGTKEKEYADFIASEVERLENILRGVLTFSREVRFHLKKQDINDAARESIRTFKVMCDEQSIKIKENINTSLPHVLIDHEQVRQAVNNLITNAIDAMPKGGTITISTSMRELYDVKFVVIEITDTGTGIPREKVDKIFEPFYTTKSIGAGTGLGLSICKKIMDEHNGLITVQSESGKGTSFTLYFPYQPSEDDSKIKCWEFHKCGVEKAEGAIGMRCTAHPNYGRICWVVAGTFCGRGVSGAIAQKLGDCRKCEFYQRVVVRKDL